MTYLIKHTKKIFSRSAQRMIETNRYYEYKDKSQAKMVADALSKGPMTVSVKLYSEDENGK